MIKFFFISAHYRSPLNYADDRLNEAYKGLTRLYQTLNHFPSSTTALHLEWMARFDAAMNDDFNTSEALALMFDLANEINRHQDGSLCPSLQAMGNILGILQLKPQHFLQHHINAMGISEAEIKVLIEQRSVARLERNFAVADNIRQQLLAHGIELEDKPEGSIWRRVI